MVKYYFCANLSNWFFTVKFFLRTLITECSKQSAVNFNGENMYQGFKDLEVYQLSFKLSMEVFQISMNFPPEER